MALINCGSSLLTLKTLYQPSVFTLNFEHTLALVVQLVWRLSCNFVSFLSTRNVDLDFHFYRYTTKPAFTCSKLAIDTLEQVVNFEHISHLVLVSIVNFE